MKKVSWREEKEGRKKKKKKKKKKEGIWCQQAWKEKKRKEETKIWCIWNYVILVQFFSFC
jgi:hypothetical protein